MIRSRLYPMANGLGNVSAFKIEITASDIANSTAFHAFNVTASSGCKIYWGDGSHTTYSSSGLYSHTYLFAGTYTIQIKGVHTNFNHYSPSSLTTPTKVIQALKLHSGITSCSNMFRGCNNTKFNLHSTFRIGSSVTACDNMFNGCSGSSFTLPSGFTIPNNVLNVSSMFRTCSGNAFALPSSFVISSNATSFGEMFYGCAGNGFTSLPSGFAIPASCRNMEFMFAYCNKLTADISNIFPTWPTGISMGIGASFVGTKVTGTLPADKLWDRTDITWFVYSTSHPFTGVTTLSNYSSIPSTWK